MRFSQPRTLVGTLLVGLCVTLAACDSNDPATDSQPQTLANLFATTNGLSTLTSALDAADLTSRLSDPGASLTVFAPPDAAFDTLTVDALTQDLDLLTSVLEYHIVEGAIGTNALTNGRRLETLQGDTLTVSASGGSLGINGATIVQGAQVGNGVAYIVDRVLLENRTAVERLGLTRNTQTLAQAVATAGLTEALNDPNASYTLFAPTESAFEDVDVEALSQSELATILRYHVVPGAVVNAADITDGQTATTLEGSDVTLTLQDGNVFVNDAQVTDADFGVRNGVIHEIDSVLVPPSNAESALENRVP